MRWLLLPFVIFRLFFSLVFFGTQAVWAFYSTQVLAGVSLTIALLISLLYLQLNPLPLPLPAVIDDSLLRATTQEWYQVSQTYPTHRDIQLNVSLLENSLGNLDGAYSAWQKAWGQDPNALIFTTHPLFSQFVAAAPVSQE